MLFPRGLHNAFLLPLQSSALGLIREKNCSNIYKLISQRPDLNTTGIPEKSQLGWGGGLLIFLGN